MSLFMSFETVFETEDALPLVEIGPGPGFSRRYMAVDRNIVLEQSDVLGDWSEVDASNVDGGADESDSIIGSIINWAFRRVSNFFLNVFLPLDPALVAREEARDSADHPLLFTSNELSLDTLQLTSSDPHLDEFHTQATQGSSTCSAVATATRLLPHDAGTRGRARRQQSDGLRACRSIDREGSARAHPEQGSLFEDDGSTRAA